MRHFPFFPKPEAGETIYSLICRCVARSGLNYTHILRKLTGQPYRQGILSALPAHIAHLSSNIPSGHSWSDSRHIVKFNTAFPYFVYFSLGEERESLIEELVSAVSTNGLSLSLGLPQYRSGFSPRHPRYCIDCIKDDSQKLGFAYFHREHQLPAVAFCWKHRTLLCHGCTCCGPYPITGNAFCMPGKCNCTRGVTPLSAHEELPSCTDALIWLAEQAAYMVNSGGCACEKIRNTLRAQASDRGFSRGSQMNYRLLSEAIEERFGREILQWLGFAAIVDGEPAPWVKRILQENLDGKRRSPAVLFKLVTGTFFESLASFERNIATPQVKQVEVASCQKRSPLLLKLESLCEQGDLTLAKVSRRLGTSSSCIIVGAHRLGVRIPLSTAIKTGLGSQLLATLRGELRDGVPKQEICCRYNCTMWQLAMIELDEPGLYEAHRQAAADRTRDKNRTLLRNYLVFKSQPSRSQIKKDLPGVYEYMLRLDSEWFWLQVPSLRHDSNIIKKRQARDWSELDRETAKRIDSTFDKMLCTQSKPVWASRRAVLSRANFLFKYQNAPENFPMVTNALTNRSESRSAFLTRKLKWAVTQLKKNGIPISVNQLRRVAGMPSSIVKAHRELVVDLSLRLNAEIGGQSFFFEKRV